MHVCMYVYPPTPSPKGRRTGRVTTRSSSRFKWFLGHRRATYLQEGGNPVPPLILNLQHLEAQVFLPEMQELCTLRNMSNSSSRPKAHVVRARNFQLPAFFAQCDESLRVFGKRASHITVKHSHKKKSQRLIFFVCRVRLQLL